MLRKSTREKPQTNNIFSKCTTEKSYPCSRMINSNKSGKKMRQSKIELNALYLIYNRKKRGREMV